jgi:hypothetical protein
MTRSMPTAYWNSSTLSVADEDYITLVRLRHPSIEDVYIAGDVVDLTSNGQLHTGFPFEFVYPQEDDDIPRGKLRIQNVDKRLGHSLHILRTPPWLRIQLVLRSDPDDVLINYDFLRLTNVSVDAVAIEGDIGVTDYTSIPWPRTRATKRILPGLYKIPLAG